MNATDTNSNNREESAMFEVIISTVVTGRVQRKSFKSRDEANRFISRKRNEWARRPNGTSRSYRIEMEYRPLLEVPAELSRIAA